MCSRLRGGSRSQRKEFPKQNVRAERMLPLCKLTIDLGMELKRRALLDLQYQTVFNRGSLHIPMVIASFNYTTKIIPSIIFTSPSYLDGQFMSFYEMRVYHHTHTVIFSDKSPLNLVKVNDDHTWNYSTKFMPNTSDRFSNHLLTTNGTAYIPINGSLICS